MPNNKSLNYMVAATCSEKTVEAYGISIVQDLQQSGERVWVMQNNVSAYQCKRNINIIKISIDL